MGIILLGGEFSYEGNSPRGGGEFFGGILFGVEFSVYHMVQRQIGLTDPPPLLFEFVLHFFLGTNLSNSDMS